MTGNAPSRRSALLPDPLFDQLEVGRRYRAIGPSSDSRLGPAPEVEIVGVTDRGYKTKAPRQNATLIAFGCERFWRPAE